MSRPHFTQTTINQAYNRQKNRCAMCGEDFDRLWIKYAEVSFAHHILRVADGGAHDISNCVILCETCHQQAHNWGRYREPVEILRSEFKYFEG